MAGARDLERFRTIQSQSSSGRPPNKLQKKQINFVLAIRRVAIARRFRVPLGSPAWHACLYIRLYICTDTDCGNVLNHRHQSTICLSPASGQSQRHSYCKRLYAAISGDSDSNHDCKECFETLSGCEVLNPRMHLGQFQVIHGAIMRKELTAACLLVFAVRLVV